MIIPEPGWADNRIHRIVKIACFGLLIGYGALVLTNPITQDEGVFLTIAKYLNHGWLPYRDLFDHKPPAIYFLFAGLFQVFGTNVFVIKIALILFILVSAVLVGKIGEILKKGTGWYAAAIFLFLMTQFEGYFLIAEPFLLLPLLGAIWILLAKAERKWLLLAGVLVGTTILFKQTALISVIPLFILAWKKKQHWWFLGGWLIPLAILGIYLLAKRCLMESWHQVVLLTLTHYSREPLSSVLHSLQKNFLWTLPIWMLLLVGLKTPFPHKKILWTLILLPLPFMFFRHYPHYWVQILPFVALIVAAVLAKIQRPVLTMAVMIFCLAIAGGKIGQDAPRNYSQLKEQLRVANILKREPTDAVLAENQFAAFYFLLPQKPLNKFLYLTEVTDAEQAEQKTINDLQSGKKVLVLWPVDQRFAYAKKLQGFLEDNATAMQQFPGLGMWVITLQR